MKILRNISAVLAGIVIGSVINGALIFLSNALFGSPDGMDLADAESVKAHAAELSPANFAGALLAHQLGTLAGALVAAMIASSGKNIFAMVVGFWFLGCGIYAASLIPAPTWFLLADFVLYLPMALLGARIGAKRHEKSN